MPTETSTLDSARTTFEGVAYGYFQNNNRNSGRWKIHRDCSNRQRRLRSVSQNRGVMTTVTLETASGQQILRECIGAFPVINPEPEEVSEE